MTSVLEAFCTRLPKPCSRRSVIFGNRAHVHARPKPPHEANKWLSEPKERLK
jgi:hypothetical protein